MSDPDLAVPVPTVLVTLGTDHHRFERLMDWVEAWLAQDSPPVRVVVQHGSSRLPAGAEGFSLCSRDELLAIIATASLVVTQGGPGGIMDSRDCGIIPIVVPRLAVYDEAVDDHQVAFTRHMARAGLVVAAFDQHELHSALNRGVADPMAMRIDVQAVDAQASISRTGALIEALVADRPSRRRH